jgi:hypothetical protein
MTDDGVALKTISQRIVGDVRLPKALPPHTPMELITDFEVWDGSRWVHASEVEHLKHLLEPISRADVCEVVTEIKDK